MTAEATGSEPATRARAMPAPSGTRDPRELGGAWTTFQRHAYRDPSPDLAAFVEQYWIVEWNYGDGPPYRQRVVPFPNVHLTFEATRATVNGVRTRPQVRELAGRGGVFGVAFRPGGFRPFLGRSVSTLADRAVPAAEVFGGTDLPASVPAVDLAGAAAAVEAVEAFLRERAPEPDPRVAVAAEAVARIAATPELTRVDAVAAVLDTTVRGLQRLFAEYVGVGPKWVIRRYRLREVTERLAAGPSAGDVDWAGLAADLGYADQAHFVRDFTAMFGEPPTYHARRY